MASSNVSVFLKNVYHGIKTNNIWSKNGTLKKEGRVIVDPTVKTWKTVYAICIEKIYNYKKQIIGYILQDFYGKTIQVTPDKLKAAIAFNKIDVVNLELTFTGDGIDGIFYNKLYELKEYDVESYEELCEAIEKMKPSHYVIGNTKIGYFEIYYGEVRDYKGYSTSVKIPKELSLGEQFLSFNDYVENLYIDKSTEISTLRFAYNAVALKNIYLNHTPDDLINTDYVTKLHNNLEIYKALDQREDVIVHVRNKEIRADKFCYMMKHRDNLNVQMELGRNSIDTTDELQSFILKAQMVGDNRFSINFSKRMLKGVNISKDLDKLVLPPVNSLGYGWHNNMQYTIHELVLPKTLKQTTLGKSDIPHSSRTEWPAGTTELDKLVDIIVVPKECKVRFVIEDMGSLGIQFITQWGKGLAKDIIVATPKTGLPVKVVDIIEYPEVELRNGGKEMAHTNIVIEDAKGNRKAVDQNILIDRTMDGSIQLMNANITFDKMIRVIK